MQVEHCRKGSVVLSAMPLTDNNDAMQLLDLVMWRDAREQQTVTCDWLHVSKALAISTLHNLLLTVHCARRQGKHRHD